MAQYGYALPLNAAAAAIGVPRWQGQSIANPRPITDTEGDRTLSTTATVKMAAATEVEATTIITNMEEPTNTHVRKTRTCISVHGRELMPGQRTTSRCHP